MDHLDLSTAIADFFGRTTLGIDRTDIDDPFLSAVCAALTGLGWQSNALITTANDGQRVTADLTHPKAAAVVMATCSPEAPALIQILKPLDWWVTCTQGDAAIVARAINAVTAPEREQSIFEVLGAHGFTAEQPSARSGGDGTWTWSHADGRRAAWHPAEPGQQNSGQWEFGSGEYLADGATPLPIVAALLGLPDQP
jgi:hypothetical protein